MNVNIPVVDAEREFGLLGRDTVNPSKTFYNRCFKADVSEKLRAVKSAKAFIKLKPVSKAIVSAARTVPLPLERKVKKTCDELILLRFHENAETWGVVKCSPVKEGENGGKLPIES